jgi:AcrR family transcriptional regulator
VGTRSEHLPAKRADEVKPQLKELTKAQVQLLEVLREPKFAKLGVDDLCKQASISRATFYNALRDENFQAHLETEMAAARTAADFAVMHNLIENAKTGTNDRMISMFQRLQGRLREGGDKPAQIVLIIGQGDLQRPKFNAETGKIVDVAAEVVKSE